MEPGRGTKKRKRASTQKVRTGCTTCKNRHVKCDEGKPACMRCINLRLKCEGYRHLQHRSSTSSSPNATPVSAITRRIPPDHPLPTFLANSPKERRAIEFFYHRAVPQLSGYFSGKFWAHCVIQLSQDEPTTRHAVFALSRMCEDDLFERSHSAGTDPEDGFALESYNKAIRSLIAQMDKPERIEVLLMTCAIFICISCLRGEIPLALKHIDGGLKLLASWREKCADPTQRNTLLAHADFKFVEETLVPMFAWLNMVASSFGQRSVSVSTVSALQPRVIFTAKYFDTIQDSITCLMNLINECIRFITTIGKKKYTEPITLADKTEQMRLISVFADWRMLFERMIETKRSTWPESILTGINVIIGSQMFITMWLTACHSTYESVWHGYKAEFEEIIQRFEIVASDTARFPDAQAKGFSFELGILPALQVVVWKCRYPDIRRKALQLIPAAPKRECLFDSKHSYALYKRVMELEESSLGLPDGQVPTGDQLPPESALIHHIDTPKIPRTTNQIPVNFLSRPYGNQGGWHIRSENINLNDNSHLVCSNEVIRSPDPTPDRQILELDPTPDRQILDLDTTPDLQILDVECGLASQIDVPITYGDDIRLLEFA